MDVSKELEAAAVTSRERHALYGDSVYIHGAVMMALFPNGMELKTREHHERMGLVNMIVTKIIRYALSMERGDPHRDSVHDLGVYAFMLEKHDAGLKDMKDVCAGKCLQCGHWHNWLHPRGICGFLKNFGFGNSIECTCPNLRGHLPAFATFVTCPRCKHSFHDHGKCDGDGAECKCDY